MQVLNKSKYRTSHIKRIAMRVMKAELKIGRQRNVRLLVTDHRNVEMQIAHSLRVCVDGLEDAGEMAAIQFAALVGRACAQRNSDAPQPHHSCPLRMAAQYEWATQFPLSLKLAAQPKPPKAPPTDLEKIDAELVHANKLAGRWLTKRKRAETAIKKYSRIISRLHQKRKKLAPQTADDSV